MFEALKGGLGSQMAYSGCQDTDWVGGHDKDILDAILLWDGFIKATFSVVKGKCGYLG